MEYHISGKGGQESCSQSRYYLGEIIKYIQVAGSQSYLYYLQMFKEIYNSTFHP